MNHFAFAVGFNLDFRIAFRLRFNISQRAPARNLSCIGSVTKTQSRATGIYRDQVPQNPWQPLLYLPLPLLFLRAARLQLGKHSFGANMPRLQPVQLFIGLHRRGYCHEAIQTPGVVGSIVVLRATKKIVHRAFVRFLILRICTI